MGKDCQCTGRSRNCSCGAKGKKTESNETVTNDTKQKSKKFITTLPKEVTQEYAQLLAEKSTNKLEEKKTGSFPGYSRTSNKTERPKFVVPASSKNKVDNEMKKKAESYLMKTELKPKSYLMKTELKPKSRLK